MLNNHMNTEEMHARWGQNVKNWRIKRGLSQEQLADMCRYGQRGTDQSTISRIEKGLAPSDELKFLLAAALRCSVKELFDYGDAVPVLPKREDVA